MRAHFCTGGQRAVLDPAERADAHAVAEFDIALEHHVDIDLDIAPHPHRAADVDARRIGHPRTIGAQGLYLAQLEGALQSRQLPRIVRAFGFKRIGDDHDLRRRIFVRRRGEHVGEVVLALRVVVAQVFQPALERGGICGDHAGVDQADAALVLVGILLFDDRGHAALGVAQDAAVTGWIRQVGREHGQPARCIEQALQRMRGDQWHIAIEHEHAGIVGHAGHRLLHGMAGAELLRLLRPLQVGLVRERGAHRLATMPVDHMDALRRQRARGVDGVRQHRSACHLLQHLRQCGFHSLALAGGQDNDMQGCAHGMARVWMRRF